MNLECNYMGIKLKNPIIIGANPYTSDIESIKNYEKSGAGAVIYKTIFQEQVEEENFFMSEIMEGYDDRNAEMTTVFPPINDHGIEEHIFRIKEIKKVISIPLIISINAVDLSTWLDYTKKMEELHVDGIEINLLFLSKEVMKSPIEIENEQINIIEQIIKNTKLPISVKLSPYYTNVYHFIQRLEKVGIKAVVLFGKYINFDINTEKKILNINDVISTRAENGNSIRAIGICYGKKMGLDLCSNTGIFTGKDVVKNILVGANCVQIVSSIIKEPEKTLVEMFKGLEEWMLKNNYNSIEDFRGLLSDKNKNLDHYYNLIKYLDSRENISELLKRVLE